MPPPARSSATGSPRSPPTSPACTRRSATSSWCRRARSRMGRAVLKLPAGALKLEDSQAAAAVGQIALARAWSESLSAHGAHRQPGAGHARRHRRAPPLSQRALDRRQAAGMAQRAGDQRERHRRHLRDPLRRQRPAGRPRRRHDERRPAGAAVGRRRALRQAAVRGRRQARAGRGAHHAGDRGDGGRVRLRAVARRHADQDRGRQDRHLRRRAYDHRVRPCGASAQGDRATARPAPGS